MLLPLSVFKGKLGSEISGLVVVSHTIPKFCKYRILHGRVADTKFSPRVSKAMSLVPLAYS